MDRSTRRAYDGAKTRYSITAGILFMVFVAALVYFNRQQSPAVTIVAGSPIQQSKLEKVEYPTEPKVLDEKTAKLITDIYDFHLEIREKCGVDDIRDSGKTTVVRERWYDTRPIKEKFWKKLQADFPELGLGEYSEESYTCFLVDELPRRLSPFGILVKPYVAISCKPDYSQFYVAEPIVSFYKVDSIKSEKITYWGKTLARDILFVDDLTIENKVLYPRSSENVVGQAFFQNVVIYKKRMVDQAEIDMTEEEMKDLVVKIRDYRNVNALESVRLSPDQDKAAFLLAYVKIFDRRTSLPETEADHLAMAIAHETGHVFDQGDELYRKSFPQPTTSSPKKYLRALNNMSVHEEINGFLSQLRYGPRKDITLSKFIGAGDPKTDVQDFYHGTASAWILKEMKKVLISQPERYGIKLLSANSIRLENQALLFLSCLSDDSLEKLAEDVMKVHRQRYDEDLTSGFFE